MIPIDQEKSRQLEKYHITYSDRLSEGMEAEVYAIDSARVLKLYAGTARLEDLLTLRDFYAGLERELLPLALPRIHSVVQEGLLLVTIEDRLPGTALNLLREHLSPVEIDQALERYLDVLLALGRLKPPVGLERYKLFDPANLSRTADGDWHAFLLRFLEYRLPGVSSYLARDVVDFPAKLHQMRALLVQPYQGELCLVHGDFCPGNLLVDADLLVTALIDFGLLTMYGDPLFDLATGWVFFDMYDYLQANLRERLLERILARLGEGVRGKLYRYVLYYSIIGANMYSPKCADGHYQWCVENLNRTEYWHGIE